MRCSIKLFCVGVLAVLLGSCTTLPPTNPDNICDIFDQKGGWYKAAKKSQDKWGSPIPIMMSFMYQESTFKHDAKPERTKILGFIPGPRKSDAYGYSQAKDATWEWYQKETKNKGADRDDFDDAIDFIGWYNNVSHKRNGIDRNDAYHLYLAYHEGHGGFSRRSYSGKSDLKNIAKKVSARSARYQSQLAGCEKRYQSSWWWPFS